MHRRYFPAKISHMTPNAYVCFSLL